PLISNLNLLDYPDRKFCFKFFLWDAIDDYYKDQARPDRIFSQTLNWKSDQLLQMLNKRLLAFSKDKITDFNVIFEKMPLDDAYKPSEIVLIFAGSSPRSVLTLCKYIIEEQVNEINHGGSSVSKITESALSVAIRRYASEIAHKHIPNERSLREISSVNNIVFTTKMLTSEIFRGHSPQAVRSKVGKWKKFEVFEVIGSELSGKKGFPTEILAFSNPCVAFIAGNLPLNSFLSEKTRRCPKCSGIILRNFEKGGKFTCNNCYYSFELARATTKEHEEKQLLIKKLSRELSRILSIEDVRTLCKAANTQFNEETFVGSPYLIWLRILQFLDENDVDGLLSLFEIVEESMAQESSVIKDVIFQMRNLIGALGEE
ncbi:MAG: hypothetical protein OIN84_18615, partial [Candidatus Methanoperedens sp.]|nr:hypothetical protein [Candidatus Methanoperedens sp.]